MIGQSDAAERSGREHGTSSRASGGYRHHGLPPRRAGGTGLRDERFGTALIVAGALLVLVEVAGGFAAGSLVPSACVPDRRRGGSRSSPAVGFVVRVLCVLYIEPGGAGAAADGDELASKQRGCAYRTGSRSQRVAPRPGQVRAWINVARRARCGSRRPLENGSVTVTAVTSRSVRQNMVEQLGFFLIVILLVIALVRSRSARADAQYEKGLVLFKPLPAVGPGLTFLVP